MELLTPSHASKVIAQHIPAQRLAYGGTNENADYGHGKGPTLGWAFTRSYLGLMYHKAEPKSAGYDVQAEDPQIFSGSIMYAPRRRQH